MYHLGDARRDARGRIRSIQDEIQSLRNANPDIDGAISQALHSSILDGERWEELFNSHTYTVSIMLFRRLDILLQTEGSPWISFSASFRVDPSLRLLEGLEQDLRQKVQRITVCRFAPNTEKYLIHTTGSPPYNPSFLQCAPNRRDLTDCRYLNSSVIWG